MKLNLLRLTLASILSIAASSLAKASHVIAAYITYEYAGSANHYVLKMHYYRDCSGMGSPIVVDICYSSLSLNINNTFTLNPVAGTGNLVSYSSCNGIAIDCSLGQGMEEWIYADTITLPQAATDWQFQYEICCRSITLTTLQGNTGMYLYAWLDNLNAPINSSPVFDDSLIYYYCVNDPSIINYSCTDPDGDSLVYTLVPALDASGLCPYSPETLLYNSPYTATNPLSSSAPITFNNTTGLFGFTPPTLQVAQVCVKVDEYRNGILIGCVIRDDQVRIIVNPAGINQISSSNFNVEVYPNPVTSTFTVKLNSVTNANFKLLDVTGRVLMQKQITNAATIDVNNFSKGIYFYRVDDSKANSCIGKLIKN